MEYVFYNNKTINWKFIPESESGETPNSLFTCFQEMSNHLKLDSYLSREKLFVPNLLSILSIKSVLEAMVLAILSFIDNLLNLDHVNLEEQDHILLYGIVLMHLCMLFTRKSILIHLHWEHKRQIIMGPMKLELIYF